MRIDRPTDGPEGDDTPKETRAADLDSRSPDDHDDRDLGEKYADLMRAIQAERAETPRRIFGKPSEGKPVEEEPDDSKADKWDDAEKASERIGELQNEGHGPQRHVEVTDPGLQARLGTAAHDQNGDAIHRQLDGHVKKETGTQVDPETGTRTDAHTGGDHRCGPYATRFDDPADFCRADEALRQRAMETGQLDQTASVSDLFPSVKPNDRFTGYYQDPATPENPDGSARFKAVDFDGATIKAYFEEADDGSLNLITMYPDPDRTRNA